VDSAPSIASPGIPPPPPFLRGHGVLCPPCPSRAASCPLPGASRNAFPRCSPRSSERSCSAAPCPRLAGASHCGIGPQLPHRGRRPCDPAACSAVPGCVARSAWWLQPRRGPRGAGHPTCEAEALPVPPHAQRLCLLPTRLLHPARLSPPACFSLREAEALCASCLPRMPQHALETGVPLPFPRPWPSVRLPGKRAFVAGVADDQGFGWAIVKALAEAGRRFSWALGFL